MNANLCVVLSFVTCLISVTVCCNEAICASIVSRCTLLKSCDCELEETGCSCCKSCFACLEHLQFECCSCVGLCPETNATTDIDPWKKSVVGDLDEADPRVWRRLSKSDWENFPVRNREPSAKDDDEDDDGQQEQANCTVIYLNKCMGEKSCEKSCLSMGAGSYRWFYDGCCQCVGPECVENGSNDSRCEVCSQEEENEELELDHTSEEEMETMSDTSSKEKVLPPWKKSIVGRFDKPVSQLWQAITQGDDTASRWHRHTFPEHPSFPASPNDPFCSVVYHGKCVAEEKCEAMCRENGAGKYRWFPNGCCECVGEECRGYGLEDIRCKGCENEVEVEEDDMTSEHKAGGIRDTSLKEKLPQR